METIGESHDARLQDVRKRIASEVVVMEKKEEEVVHHHAQLLTKGGNRSQLASEYLQATKELKDIQMNNHPGFVIPFDNIDLHLSRRNMSMSDQNRDVHWVNHGMVENRVSGNHLSTQREKEVLDIPNIQFLPGVEDQRRQRLNYVVLISRILVDYFDAFIVFKDVCIRHIPHKYSQQLSVKSSKVIYK